MTEQPMNESKTLCVMNLTSPDKTPPM